MTQDKMTDASVDTLHESSLSRVAELHGRLWSGMHGLIHQNPDEAEILYRTCVEQVLPQRWQEIGQTANLADAEKLQQAAGALQRWRMFGYKDSEAFSHYQSDKPFSLPDVRGRMQTPLYYRLDEWIAEFDTPDKLADEIIEWTEAGGSVDEAVLQANVQQLENIVQVGELLVAASDICYSGHASQDYWQLSMTEVQ